MTVALHCGDCLNVLRALPDASVEAVVTDPPYGLEFMGKDWDRHPSPAAYQSWCASWARECLRALKPGGYLLAFGGTRTSHRLVAGIEDAGFVIRDSLVWLYGVGFPKHHSALKPAHEPIVLAQRPLDGTYAANVAVWGCGALDIDGCRIGTAEDRSRPSRTPNAIYGGGTGTSLTASQSHPAGRWPANVVLDEDAAAALDAQTGVNVSRFFYCAKASRAERDAGLDDLPLTRGSAEQYDSRWKDGTGEQRRPLCRNTHPTVKPVALMRWLVRLARPPGGVVLDPFAGSGTTGVACVMEGRDAILIERDAAYLDIAARRIAAAEAARQLPLTAAAD